jgi:tetratricopeptide (TPR) repeat protein
LDDLTYAKITHLCKVGDEHAKAGNLDSAIREYEAAFSALPDPGFDWQASTWILTALGDAYFHARNCKMALEALQDAMHCPDAIGNPFIHLRLGLVQDELGNLVRAEDGLAGAYMGADEEVFAEEDPKYFTMVKSVLRL